MFDFILGLPMHALVVHGLVVLVPLLAVLAALFALVPRWRGPLRWATATGAVLAAGLAWVGAESGEALLVRISQVRATSTDFELVQAHVDAGYRVRLAATVFMAIVLAAAWLLGPRSREDVTTRPLEVILVVLVVLASLSLVVTIVLAGHAGSAAVWSDLG
ncbi:hypothetical protein [Intrasporangium calvum]|uniref:hypothetical protein n=1 Tax=Intrasporangium calvum TaxID=53358 RepID=UPI000DF5F6CC|nr:hypothetical protein [Intrasporangium calvum]AXG13270.1 hypothetical protein DN585_07495 [Intrasporangium calvum]